MKFSFFQPIITFLETIGLYFNPKDLLQQQNVELVESMDFEFTSQQSQIQHQPQPQPGTATELELELELEIKLEQQLDPEMDELAVTLEKLSLIDPPFLPPPPPPYIPPPPPLPPKQTPPIFESQCRSYGVVRVLASWEVPGEREFQTRALPPCELTAMESRVFGLHYILTFNDTTHYIINNNGISYATLDRLYPIKLGNITGRLDCHSPQYNEFLTLYEQI